MKEFFIQIQEILACTITIQADSLPAALETARRQYKAKEIILNYSDLQQTRFIESSHDQEKEECIRALINYLYADEEKNYLESEESENHIFCTIKRLSKLLNS